MMWSGVPSTVQSLVEPDREMETRRAAGATPAARLLFATLERRYLAAGTFCERSSTSRSFTSSWAFAV